MQLNVFVLLMKEKLFLISVACFEAVSASKDTVTLSEEVKTYKRYLPTFIDSFL